MKGIFSADGYFRHTPVWVKKVMLSFKAIVGVIAISEFYAGNAKVAFFALVSGALVDEISKFIKEDTSLPVDPDK